MFKNKIEWPTTLFLIITPIVTFITLPIYLYNNGFQWGLFLMALIFAGATNLSITAGYHRLMAHKSYDAHPIAKIFFLLIGASAFQGSALKWSSDHRRHHANIDTEKDPYNINEGFWHAHMGWLFLKRTVSQEIIAPDLQKDQLVAFQHNHYYPIAVFMGFGVPALLGWTLGSAFGGFLIIGALRIVLTQQSTFFVNSLCHTLGKQTYSKEISARDSWFVAVLTHGEGYHNFHHKFQIDYRNGIKWYHWDPTKWVIQTLNIMGLAKKLRKISNAEILKARLQVESAHLITNGHAEERILLMKEKILSAQLQMKKLSEDYQAKKLEMKNFTQLKKQEFHDFTELKKQELHHMVEVKRAEFQEFAASTKHDFQEFKQAQVEAYERKIKELKMELAIAQLEFEAGLKQWQLCLNA